MDDLCTGARAGSALPILLAASLPVLVGPVRVGPRGRVGFLRHLLGDRIQRQDRDRRRLASFPFNAAGKAAYENKHRGLEGRLDDGRRPASSACPDGLPRVWAAPYPFENRPGGRLGTSPFSTSSITRSA